MSIASGIYVKKYEATTLFLSITKFKLQKGILVKLHNRFLVFNSHTWFLWLISYKIYVITLEIIVREKCCFQTRSRSSSEILDSMHTLRKCKHGNHHSIFFIFLLKIMPSNIIMSKNIYSILSASWVLKTICDLWNNMIRKG